LTATEKRLRKSYDIQNQLLELLEKEVKGPLSATGTFFDLVEDSNRGTNFGLEVATKATRQFQQTLNVLDVLLEWGSVRHLERSRERPVTDTHSMVCSVFSSFKESPFARRFTLLDRHKTGGLERLPEDELRFMLKMILFWLCEVAEEGDISVDRMNVEAGMLYVGMRLKTGSLFSRMGQRVERVVNGKVCAEGKAFPADGFYLALAREIVDEYEGALRVRMDASFIEVEFEMNLETY
jgi:hypothetical protein